MGGRPRKDFGGLGRALTNPISRGRRPRSAIPTHCEMNPDSTKRMAQWTSWIKKFGTRVVVLRHGPHGNFQSRVNGPISDDPTYM